MDAGVAVTATGGAGEILTVNTAALVAVPKGFVTAILPVVPTPGIAVICVALTTKKDWAGVPPNVTPVAPVKLVPVIVTVVVPEQPEAGENKLTVGA
jgi:hypothetical protein